LLQLAKKLLDLHLSKVSPAEKNKQAETFA